MVSRHHDNIVELKFGNDKAKVHLFGATVISWTVNGIEQLFLSSKAVLDGSKAIRGGIPLVFPQFGPSTGRKYPLAQHGFARLVHWRVITKDESSVLLEFKSHDHPTVVKDYPHSFTLQYRVTLKSGSIDMEAMVFNTGVDNISFDWLFHTYFKVDDVGKTSVGEFFKDYQSDNEFCEQFKIKKDINIVSTQGMIELSVKNMDDVVVWNPGPEKAGLMADLGRGEERTFICVEAGAISPSDKVTLSPGQSITFEQTLKCK